MAQIFANNVESTLAADLTSGATSLTLTSGAAFPSPTAGDYFLATLYKVSAGIESAWEIVKVTARSSNVLTIVRAQDGTTAKAFVTGDYVSLRVTAGAFAGLQSDIDLRLLASASGKKVLSVQIVHDSVTYDVTATPALTPAGNGFGFVPVKTDGTTQYLVFWRAAASLAGTGATGDVRGYIQIHHFDGTAYQNLGYAGWYSQDGAITSGSNTITHSCTQSGFGILNTSHLRSDNQQIMLRRYVSNVASGQTYTSYYATFIFVEIEV